MKGIAETPHVTSIPHEEREAPSSSGASSSYLPSALSTTRIDPQRRLSTEIIPTISDNVRSDGAEGINTDDQVQARRDLIDIILKRQESLRSVKAAGEVLSLLAYSMSRPSYFWCTRFRFWSARAQF